MTQATPSCPACLATDVVLSGQGTWTCQSCGTQFEDSALPAPKPRTRPAAPKPKPKAPPADSLGTAGPDRRLIVVGAVVLLLALVVGGLWGLRADPNRTSVPDTLAPMPAPQPAAERVGEKAPADEIVLTHVEYGRARDGVPFWIVTYANEGKYAVVRPFVTVTLKDSEGVVVGTRRGYAPVPMLDGESELPILIAWPQAPGHATFEVTAHQPTYAAGMPYVPELGVKDVSYTKRGRRYIVEGVALNMYDQPVVVGDIVVVGRKRDGAPVAYAAGPPELRVLEPGQSTRFELVVDRWKMEDPEVWTTLARGSIQER